MLLLNLILIAVGLSMDTFSLSLGYGIIINDKLLIKKLSLTVGIFHFIMPLVGNSIGESILKIIKISPQIVEPVVFLAIAIELVLSLFKKEELTEIKSFLSILAFSFAVSIDSFIVGIGLDGVTTNTSFSSLIFMIVSLIFTYVGLNTGKKIKSLIGNKAEILGIIILTLLSISSLLKI